MIAKIRQIIIRNGGINGQRGEGIGEKDILSIETLFEFYNAWIGLRDKCTSFEECSRTIKMQFD